MASGGVLEDLPLPLNPPLSSTVTIDANLKPWTNEQKLLLISLAHELSKDTSNETKIEPPWEEISRRLESQKSKQRRGTEWFSPQQCKNQYQDLMNRFDLLLQADERLKSNRTSSVSKHELLLQTIASATIRTSERKEEDLKKQIQYISKRISTLQAGDLDNSLSDISDGDGTDSETEEEMSHPFYDEDSFIEGLQRAFRLLDDTFPLSPPNEAKPVSLADMESATSSTENTRASAPSFSTSELKKTSPSSQLVSPELKNLVYSAIAGAAQEDKTKTVSPTNAPTLSRLLEMPIRDRGQPLPQIHSLMPPKRSLSSETNVSLLTQSLVSPSKQESPTKLFLPSVPINSPVKPVIKDSSRQGASLPSMTLSMPSSSLKSQEEIELANAFVIASGLVPQDATESNDIEIKLPIQNATLQVENTSNIASSATSSTLLNPLRLKTDDLHDPLVVPIKSVESSEDVKPEVPLIEKSTIVEGEVAKQPEESLRASPTKASENGKLEPVTLSDVGLNGSPTKLTPSILSSTTIQTIDDNVNCDASKDKDEKDGLTSTSSEMEIEKPSDSALNEVVVDKEVDGGVDGKQLDVDETKVEVDGSDMKEKGKSASGRGKKCLQDKPDDSSSAPTTRNAVKEKGVKLEEPQSNSKKQNKEAVNSSSSTITRRSVTRSAPHEETKVDIKPTIEVPSSPSKPHGVGQRKTANKPTTEVSTPNLRSRRGATPTPLSNPLDDPGSIKVISNQQEIDELELERKQTDSPDFVSSANKEAKSETLETEKSSPKKISTGKDKTREKSDAESSGDHSDVQIDEDSRPLSAMGEESCDNEESAKKKPVRVGSRKERTESGEMGDDDNSNSGFDAQQKKRLTRRSVKVTPLKAEEKSREDSADGSTGKDQDSVAGPETKVRQSKTLIRLKHLHDEAQQVFGDIEMKDEDANGKRLTRARTKTSTSPRIRTKSSGSSKGANTSTVEPESTGDAEPGPSRATRSRAAAAATGSGSSSTLETLPLLPVDSNPSSPSSSTTNSTILEEDKDQKAFRKSVMLVWNRIAAHRSASLFMKPITDENVPGYSQKVKRPMDLLTIKKYIETGVTKTFAAFERDIYLMFLNCFMFNPVTHSVTAMAKEMEIDSMAIIQEYKKTQQLLKSSQEGSETVIKKEAESDLEQETHEEVKPKSKPGRKRRNRSTSTGNAEEVVETKRRTLRTSTTAATTATTSWQGTRKGKHQASPDIISTSRTE